MKDTTAFVKADREERFENGQRLFGRRCWARTDAGWMTYDPCPDLQARIDERAAERAMREGKA